MTAEMDREESCGAVVVGGSAGSLDPLLSILEQLPKDYPLPVAVVVHTPKDQPSVLVDALAARCPLPVREPVDKEPLQPGTVFVAAPGYHLLVERGARFAFSVDEPVSFAQPSIDVLFESAAESYGRRLLAVILSGANHDGARGLAAVFKAGGLAFVQAPDEAAYPEMPKAALRACPAARALPACHIGRRLVAELGSPVGR